MLACRNIAKKHVAFTIYEPNQTIHVDIICIYVGFYVTSCPSHFLQVCRGTVTQNEVIRSTVPVPCLESNSLFRLSHLGACCFAFIVPKYISLLPKTAIVRESNISH